LTANPSTHLELAVSRELAAGADAVLEVANDPESYVDWVPALRSLTRRRDGSLEAELGYFTYRRTFDVHPRAAPADTVLWLARDGGLTIAIEFRATPLEQRRTLVEFLARADEGDPLEGLGPTREVGMLLVQSVATHALARLERVAKAVERDAGPA
jgi:hypothetical protein